MSDRLKSVLAVVGSLVLAGGLLWLSLRNADMAAVGAALREARWAWLVPMALVSVLSVVLRAWRWRVLLASLGGAAPSLGLATGATFIGYLVNYAAPRAGEVARAVNVSARGGLPFASVAGTVVAERVLDVLTLGVALLIVLALYGGRVAFLTDGLGAALAARGPLLALLAVVGFVAAAVALWFLRKSAGRLARLVGGFRDGLATVVRARRPVALVASTVGIWASYAVMAALPLYLLGISGLSLVDAFAVMAVGAVGMALPSPGGAGSYHYATVQALTVLFAVGASDAATYALLSHAAQLVFYAVGGGVALVAQGTSLAALRAAPTDGRPEARAEAPA